MFSGFGYSRTAAEGGDGTVGIWVWAAEPGFGPRTFNGMFLAFERKMGLFLVFCSIFW